MMKFIRVTVAVLFAMTVQGGFAQITSVSQIAKDNFEKQYRGATNVTWSNDVIRANVNFELNGEEMNAEYNNNCLLYTSRCV